MGRAGIPTVIVVAASCATGGPGDGFAADVFFVIPPRLRIGIDGTSWETTRDYTYPS